jgi:hypothetical protein
MLPVPCIVQLGERRIGDVSWASGLVKVARTIDFGAIPFNPAFQSGTPNVSGPGPETVEHPRCHEKSSKARLAAQVLLNGFVKLNSSTASWRRRASPGKSKFP